MFSTNTNKYKLFNEDALSLLSRIPTSSIDLILTDPPYNIALNSTGNIKLTNGKTINNDIAEWDKYSINPLDYVKDFKRVISPKEIFSFLPVILFLVNGMKHLTKNSKLFNYLYGTKLPQQKAYIKIVF